MLINTHRNLLKAQFIETVVDSSRLEDHYRELSSCLEHVNELISQFEDYKEQACFIILKEDFEDLVEECEQYLFTVSKSQGMCTEDFESRCDTVIEELMYILSEQTIH